MELNVPVNTPNAMIHENGRMTSPAKMSSDSVAASTVACVSTERGSVSLIERLSTSRKRFLALLLQVLTNAIEDDDRVVERVTDDREERGDDGQRHLEVHHGEERHRREDVVRRRDDRRHAEPPLETEREIDERHEERDEDRGDRLRLELGADAAPTDSARTTFAWFAGQCSA